MGKAKYIILAMFLCLLGCAKETDEPIETNLYDFILGHWDEVAYQGKDGTFEPSSTGVYFEFRADKTFTYYKGWAINESEINIYTANSNDNTVICKWSNNNDRVIKVEFESDNDAMFTISNTNTTYKTKMKRN